MEPEKCTYKNCDAVGIGRTAETARNWLCGPHLEQVTEAIRAFYEGGGQDEMKRMLSQIVKSRGGAKEMAKDFGAPIRAGATMVGAMRPGQPPEEGE